MAEPDEHVGPSPSAKCRLNFDFVEIGTAFWGTVTQACARHPLGKHWILDLLPKRDDDIMFSRGLAVDMNINCLDLLPDLPNVKKVCAAVSSSSRTQSMKHVPASVLRKWEAIFVAKGRARELRALRLAHGCSSLGHHAVLHKALSSIGLRHVLRERRVRAISMKALLRRLRVGNIGVLALDCEGHDCVVLKGLLRACSVRPGLFPEWLVFETNGLNDDHFGPGTEERTVKALETYGYELVHGGGFRRTGLYDTVMWRKSSGARGSAASSTRAARASTATNHARPAFRR